MDESTNKDNKQRFKEALCYQGDEGNTPLHLLVESEDYPI
jgi:hypothetical protein